MNAGPAVAASIPAQRWREAPLEQADYCQFAKRNLDGMSWLYPLVNNRIGDALNLELRHEHLFFIQGDRVIFEIGYSENGSRFREAEMGKPIRTLAEMRAAGYWLVGRRFDPSAMREALGRVEDGNYYFVLSNQCQDWADRIRRAAGRVEKERGIGPGATAGGAEDRGEALKREVPPTAPAAWYLGLITLVAGGLGVTAPILAANYYLHFIALLFVAQGVSDVVYAFSSRAWRPFLHIALIAALELLAGAAILGGKLFEWKRDLPVLSAAFVAIGAAKIALALRNRPLRAWGTTLMHGALLLAVGALIFWQGTKMAGWLLGLTVSLSLIAGGVSTVILGLKTRGSSEAG